MLMPLNKILYYPDFEPSKVWFRSHLLFYDTIHSVVPEELNYKSSEQISDITERLPTSFEPIAPQNSDKKLNRFNIKVFDSAFTRIEKNPKKFPNEFKIEIHPDKCEILGNAVFFHDRKMSEEMYDLLERHHFLNIDSRKFQEFSGIDLKDYSVVNRYAADLILSHIADKMATRHHISTITGNPFAYSVNTLNLLPPPRESQKRGLLISTIIRCIIPEKIEELSTYQFLQVREEYSEIWEAIHVISKNLAELHNLEEIQNHQILQNEIEYISSDFTKQVASLEKSLSPTIVKKFVPIFFGSTGIICSDYFGEPIRTGGRVAAIALSQIISDQISIPEPELVQFQRRISILQHEINWHSDMRRLLKTGWY
jgi:hypothetical protein